MTPWTVALQAPLSMGFPGQNTGVGGHALLQGIFLTQGSNLGLLHYKQSLYHWATREAPHVHVFATPWTAAHQAPLSMGFSGQEYWSG